MTCVAVPGRNQTLFHWSHYRIRSAIAQNFRYEWGSHALCKLMNTWCICTTRMSPNLNGSFVLQCSEHGNAIKIRNGTMFDFYPGLPHMADLQCAQVVSYRCSMINPNKNRKILLLVDSMPYGRYVDYVYCILKWYRQWYLLHVHMCFGYRCM